MGFKHPHQSRSRWSWCSARVVMLGAVLALWLPGAVAFGAPANDNFGAAFSLSGTSATSSGNSSGATMEPGEPAHSREGGHSVWWAWTASVSGAITINTCGSNFDTVLAVYIGSAVSALTRVASNDDACSDQSSVTFNAQRGQTYRIAVDGSFEETGNIRLALAPTLSVRTATLRRRHRIDATRLFIDAALADEDQDVPSLTFQRGRTKVMPDLDEDNEIDSPDNTRFRYTFDWSCGRAGTWRWTVSVLRDGVRASRQGFFSVPRCVTHSWLVSSATVVRGFAANFGRQAARYLRCRAVGSRRGSRAAIWRCRIVRPGFVCTGSFLFRYRRTFQRGDLVESRRSASGSVTCRR